jgi:TolA-binding protein
MGGPAMGGEMMQPDDEVIDVDDLTQSQEKAEEKIDAMNSKFEKLMGAVETLIKQNAQREKEAAEAERRSAEQQARLEAELEKRIPTPQQRMTMRSTKSAPYAMTPNEYMNNYAPDNYSDADDNNGADDMQYQITKDDIDRFTDYNSIAKELDIAHQGLNDILNF